MAAGLFRYLSRKRILAKAAQTGSGTRIGADPRSAALLEADLSRAILRSAGTEAETKWQEGFDLDIAEALFDEAISDTVRPH